MAIACEHYYIVKQCAGFSFINIDLSIALGQNKIKSIRTNGN